ncbi:MAG: TIGR02466 family protein [Pseudomonadota bacterium]
MSQRGDENRIENLDANTLPCFATPMVNYFFADSDTLNETLARTIMALEQEEPGLSKSNVGGWHSELDLLEHDDDSIRTLRARLEGFSLALLKQFVRSPAAMEQSSSALRLEAWANVTRHGQYNSVHSHPNALWSMVYYVTGNETLEAHPFSGKLELLDPRPAASLTYDEDSGVYGRLLINPRAGQLIAFPAWLQHQVHCYFGQAPRISIAINLLP